MLKKCQILGFLVLVLGIIGSFYVAYEFGNVVDFEYSGRVFYERDWNLTCAYFATGCFSSILLWTIFSGMAEIIEKLDNIINQQKNMTK
ncbi:hypothetical protein D7Y05_08505 [bacterium 1XD42-54]|nr:hypothetical protein D7Y05_08505 [bacterium 1XD42-54]